MREKTKLMDRDAMRRAITRISYEILEKNKGAENLVLAGVVRRGRYLAERISRQIETVEGVKVPCLPLNTAAYRDDAPEDVRKAREKNCEPAFIEGKTVIVVTHDRMLAEDADRFYRLQRGLIVEVHTGATP